MHFTFAAFFWTLFICAASQSTSTVTASAPIPTANYGPNYFITPTNGYLLYAGQPYIFKWQPTTNGTVTLTLRNGTAGDLSPGIVLAGE